MLSSSLLMILVGSVIALPQPQPQPQPQDVVTAERVVMTPEEAAAQALAIYMPDIKLAARANQIIPVVVGGTQDVFVPNVVTAAVGDVLQFQFSNGNHTVTQSAETAACQPLQATTTTGGTGAGVHSGHVPFVDGQTTVGTFNMPVLNTSTMFLYCATGPHCQEGQVLVVNPTTPQQVVDYAKLAAASAQSGDGTVVAGGTVAQIPLELAAFTPAAPQAQAGGDGGAASASSAAVITSAPAGTSAATVPGTTTVVVTVDPPA